MVFWEQALPSTVRLVVLRIKNQRCREFPVRRVATVSRPYFGSYFQLRKITLHTLQFHPMENSTVFVQGAKSATGLQTCSH